MKPEAKASLTKVLTYHVVPGKMTAADLAAKIKAGNGTAKLKTVEGEELTLTMDGDKVKVAGMGGSTAYVSQADVTQSNGVVHVVDWCCCRRCKPTSGYRNGASPFDRAGRFFVRYRGRRSTAGLAIAIPACERSRIRGRSMDFISILSIFVLACFVGYYVVWSVTPALHTPLMAVTNAISSVIIVGALVAAAAAGSGTRAGSGCSAVVLASINIFGGFAVTARMLAMYKKKER